MTTVRKHAPSKETSESTEEPNPSAVEVTPAEVTEALLDEIDAILEADAKEKYKEKLKSINFVKKFDPCEAQREGRLVRLPLEIIHRLGLKVYDGPPCAGC